MAWTKDESLQDIASSLQAIKTSLYAISAIMDEKHQADQQAKDLFEHGPLGPKFIFQGTDGNKYRTRWNKEELFYELTGVVE